MAWTVRMHEPFCHAMPAGHFFYARLCGAQLVRKNTYLVIALPDEGQCRVFDMCYLHSDYKQLQSLNLRYLNEWYEVHLVGKLNRLKCLLRFEF